MVIKIECSECEEMKDPIDFAEAEVFAMCKECDDGMQELFLEGERLRPKNWYEKDVAEREHNLNQEKINKLMGQTEHERSQ